MNSDPNRVAPAALRVTSRTAKATASFGRAKALSRSGAYRSLIQRYFPRARIVADRFHVIRLIQHHFMDLCRQIAPHIKQHRGYLAALRKRPDRLTERQQRHLEELFSCHPALQPIYDQMQRVCSLMRKRHQKSIHYLPIQVQ